MELAGPLREEFVTLDDVVSPAPWLVLSSLVDIPAAVDDYCKQHPQATVEDVVCELDKTGPEVNGALVAQQMLSRTSS